MQNEREKFKENFIRRLVKFSIVILKLEAGQLLKKADEISKVIGASVLTLKGKK